MIIDDVALEIKQRVEIFPSTQIMKYLTEKGYPCHWCICKYWWSIPREIEYEIVPHTIVFGEIVKHNYLHWRECLLSVIVMGMTRCAIFIYASFLYPDGELCKNRTFIW
ncbi:MAG: hypothetical protein CM1200mP30_10720 [Pseudomonadota bacterium]|nr:MAG: hypothetical protein CM1200mP30_10720 [Pseudomonadota bacterium]